MMRKRKKRCLPLFLLFPDKKEICLTEHVLGIDLIQTRIFGNKIYVDMEIGVDGSLTLQQAHEIAEAVHEDIEQNFPKVKHIMVHVNPAAVPGQNS